MYYSQYSNNDTNLIFINRLDGVICYRIRPQQTVLLVDSTQSRIYIYIFEIYWQFRYRKDENL